MNVPQPNPRQSGLREAWFAFLLFILYFGYFLFRIEPELYFMHQQPAFYGSPQYLHLYLNHPGGFLSAMAALFSQFYLIPALGALMISILFLGIALTTRYWMRAIGIKQYSFFLSWVPVVLVFAMHHEYGYPLAGTIGLFIPLFFFTILHLISKARPFLFQAIAFLIFPLIYFLCGGPAFVFVLLCILFGLSIHEKRQGLHLVMIGLLLILAGLMPFFPIERIMMAPLRERVLHHLLFSFPSHLSWISCLIYGFYPLMYILSRWHIIRPLEHRTPRIANKPIHVIVQFAAVMVLSALVAGFTFDLESKTNLSVELSAREHRWEDVLQIAQERSTPHFYTAIQVNRALYHTGRLLEVMFSSSQTWGMHGLFYPQEYGYVYPIQISDLYFDLAHINESQHWAYEAQAIYRQSPWNLQRLIQTHLLKGNLSAAKRYLYTLQRSPFYKNRADTYLQMTEHPSAILRDPVLKNKATLMPGSDFITHTAIPRDDLEALLTQNPDNRMAFEYLMALGLLSKQLELVSKYTDWVSRNGYDHIPTHLEEAYLVYLTSDPSHNLSIHGYQIRQKTAERYRDYLTIASRYKSDPEQMRAALQARHGNTYWFYYMFHQQRDIDEMPIPPLGLARKKK